MGHSVGTYIALLTVQQYPDYYHTYIAISQMSNQVEEVFHYMKEQYGWIGNQTTVKNLKNMIFTDKVKICVKSGKN